MGCTGLLWNFGECLIGQLHILCGQTRPSLDRCKWAEWVWPLWRSVMVAVGKELRNQSTPVKATSRCLQGFSYGPIAVNSNFASLYEFEPGIGKS